MTKKTSEKKRILSTMAPFKSNRFVVYQIFDEKIAA